MYLVWKQLKSCVGWTARHLDWFIRQLWESFIYFLVTNHSQFIAIEIVEIPSVFLSILSQAFVCVNCWFDCVSHWYQIQISCLRILYFWVNIRTFLVYQSGQGKSKKTQSPKSSSYLDIFCVCVFGCYEQETYLEALFYSKWYSLCHALWSDS